MKPNIIVVLNELFFSYRFADGVSSLCVHFWILCIAAIIYLIRNIYTMQMRCCLVDLFKLLDLYNNNNQVVQSHSISTQEQQINIFHSCAAKLNFKQTKADAC